MSTVPRFRHKSIRISGYDYTSGGVYFVTMGDSMELSRFGELIEETWCDLPNHHPNVSLDSHVIMPNHFHGLIVLADQARQGRAATVERFQKAVRGSLPTIVRSFKSAATRRINVCRGSSVCPIWQRNYYEHVIRDDDEFYRARKYIRDNPLKWALDPENPEYVRSQCKVAV